MEITYDLGGVFDKTDAQRWNKSHVHYCYVTMQSICCHGDKSLVPKSWSVIGDFPIFAGGNQGEVLNKDLSYVVWWSTQWCPLRWINDNYHDPVIMVRKKVFLGC